MMVFITTLIVALCATILYIDGKMIDAQNDYLTAIHDYLTAINECLDDQAKEIESLWLMSDYFHRRIGGANEEHSRADQPTLYVNAEVLQAGGVYAEGADVRADECADRSISQHGALDEARREDLDEGV